MLMSGMVSVTFRALAPDAIMALVRQAGLGAIEWGGDVHVPPGHHDLAAAVRGASEAAGIRIVSYGSYYRVGHDDPAAFEPVLDTAARLGAPMLRVWAGRVGSAQADEAQRARVILDLRRIARLAATRGVTVSTEYHANTLTDTCESALQLLDAAGEPNLRTHWQPVPQRSDAQNLVELTCLLPHLGHLHAFHLVGRERRPLAEARDAWKAYLAVAARSGRDHAVLLEFVADDDPARFLEEAGTLSALLDSVGDRREGTASWSGSM